MPARTVFQRTSQRSRKPGQTENAYNCDMSIQWCARDRLC